MERARFQSEYQIRYLKPHGCATKTTMKPVAASIKKWTKAPAFREAYDALEPEYALASALIEARQKAGLSQQELARRMKTTQPAIARMERARMERARQQPSTATLLKVAKATGTRLQIHFVGV
jgi:ribosome-binding protein aMBF1 (putative translation factor)